MQIIEARDTFVGALTEQPDFQKLLFYDVNPLTGTEKRRIIWAPNDAMRAIHKAFIGELRKRIAELNRRPSVGTGSRRIRILKYATGGVPGCSPITHIRAHTFRKKGWSFPNRHLLALDLKDAYGHVQLNRLVEAIIWLCPYLQHRKDDVERFLVDYCMTPGTQRGLAIGAPASPDLFNLYGHLYIDVPLVGVLEQHRLTYRRYLDDLTFSSANQIRKDMRRKIRAVIGNAGFPIAERKTQVRDLWRGSIVICGITTSYAGPRRKDFRVKLALSKRYVDQLRSDLEQRRCDADYAVPWTTLHGRVAMLRRVIRYSQREPDELEATVLRLARWIPRLDKDDTQYVLPLGD